MKFCKSCGSEVEDCAQFCSICGIKISASTTTSVKPINPPSEKRRRYQHPYNSGQTLVIICLAILLAISVLCDSPSEKELENEYRQAIIEAEEEKEIEYESGYNDGYTAGLDESSGMSVVDNYYEIDDMGTDEIIKYLEDTSDTRYWSEEEAYSLFVYAFQRGYENHKNGVWDDMTQEYINNWAFFESDAVIYRDFEY